ncbi:LuxR C-terminal-related transcriptional regulator [Streptomyces sp. NPDC007346]|uniref:response regulator transcription factor n=1 Tax=Streptomyces sp. NPDC007346 TaxID=3154682 RepID=UPI003452905D
MSRTSRPASEGLAATLDSEQESDCAQARTVSALTPRERQVLDGVKEGNSNRMVARLLGISERTVKVHLHSIFIKLGAASRTEAVIEGIRSGCISLH